MDQGEKKPRLYANNREQHVTNGGVSTESGEAAALHRLKGQITVETARAPNESLITGSTFSSKVRVQHRC